MKELLYLLRAMQLYAHSAHHLVKGNSFFSDHEFFSEVYSELEDEYDAVAERIIGLFGEQHLKLQDVLQNSFNKIADAPSIGIPDNKLFFEYQFGLEHRLCDLIQQVLKAGVSAGIEQLIGEFCNKSEMRQYKIKQRLK
jgi:hypothetical protein